MTKQNKIISMIIVTAMTISLLFSTTVVGVSAAGTATGGFDMDISVEPNMNYLQAFERIAVEVNVTNKSGRSVPSMAIVALFDRENKMINVAYISKLINVGATAQLKAGFRLPADVTDHVFRVFVWEGESLENTTMYPLSDVFELGPEPERE